MRSKTKEKFLGRTFAFSVKILFNLSAPTQLNYKPLGQDIGYQSSGSR